MRARVVWVTVILLMGFAGLESSHAQEGVNLLANGGFEEGPSMPLDTWAPLTWNVYGDHTIEVVSQLTGAAAPESPIEGNYSLHVIVPAAGTNFWDVGLQHIGHTYEAGKKYTLSLFLKSKQGTAQVNIKPELGQDPWTGYGERSVTITNEWAEYSVTTPVFASNTTPGTLTFHIGYAAADFWVDGVRFYEGDYVPPLSPRAHNPNPRDRGTQTETWANLSWDAGSFAVTHNVYFGDKFDDVNAGAANVFYGNQPSAFFVIGLPGMPYPDNLVPGTTYYWRVDEVNDLHPDSPWRGNVWSFLVPPRKAYEPNPPDTAKFLDPKVTLTWKAGMGARIHQVHFGDNFANVEAGAPGTAKGSVGATTYAAGTLQSGKTYYWRIDEFDGANTYKGDVWTFTTAGTGGGVRADYYKGMNFETYVLTRTDPKISFNWGDPGGPDPAVGNDQFSVRWTGEVEAAFTETYTFYANSDDGVRLWVDGQLLVDRWVNQAATENSGTISLIAGNTYNLVMEYYEDGGGAVAELRWSSPRTPKQVIPQAALSLPVKANSPTPRSGSVDVAQTTLLTWGAGDNAASHEVYFGADADAVKNATKASPEYKGVKALGSESYDPGKLAWATAYYWRVDEVNNANTASPWVGGVWSFTTADFLVVDDFESYNDIDPPDPRSNRIFEEWIDGFATPTTNGALVGNELPPYAEQTIVHGGDQSMPVTYNNNLKYSEAAKTLVYPRDWTEGGVGELSLWFRGLPGSVGSFTENPAGTYTMTASGADITGTADEFHYAYKMLTGAGSIIAKIGSIQNTNGWAKAGVMIRDTLDVGSQHAMVFVTPGNGVVFEYRSTTGDNNVGSASQQTGITAPQWVKIDRSIGGTFTASYSGDGVTWQPLGSNPSVNIQMTNPSVYIGLALTATNVNATCQAVFSNVTTTGAVTGQWINQDVGIASNAAERLYVAVSNVAGAPAVVYHDNPAAAQTNAWARWVIPLQKFADQGISLTNVNKLAIGLGTRGNTTALGGSGQMYFDDIRLYRPTPPPEQVWLEAEAAATITPPLKVYDDATASGGKCIGTDAGSGDVTASPPADGVATYSFTVAGGTYKILLHVVIPPGDNNSLWLNIPGATYNRTVHSSGWIRFNDITDGTAWHWDEVHSSDATNQRVDVTLPAGTHTLQIARREETALIDAILITANLDLDEATLPAVIP